MKCTLQTRGVNQSLCV